MEPIRVQKWIAELGLASRREAEKWIREGRLAINGQVATLGSKVDQEKALLTLDGKPLQASKAPKVYWLLHKPDKVLVSKVGEEDKATIYDLPRLQNLPFRVFAVGRLDYRTEGLLLLTNDGELCHRLTHPSFKVPRHYQIVITGRLTADQCRDLRQGIELEDGKARCDLVTAPGLNLGQSKGSSYFVTVYEGRNRLVRRLFEHFGHKVVRLVRYGYGDLRLSLDLKAGEYRQLSSQEIKALKRAAGL